MQTTDSSDGQGSLDDVTALVIPAKRGQRPALEFNRAGCEPRFMRHLENKLRVFDYNNNPFFNSEDQLLWAAYVARGLDGVRELVPFPAGKNKDGYPPEATQAMCLKLITRTMSRLGEGIFASLHPRYHESPIPKYYFSIGVEPHSHALEVKCEFLPKIKVNGEEIYFSPHKPTVTKGDQRLQVGFLPEALEKASGRVSPIFPVTYRYFSTVRKYFVECVYWEIINLPSGQDAIRLLGNCSEEAEDFHFRTVAQLDEDSIRRGNIYVVLGYFPIRIEGAFALAIDFFHPGYRYTPECDLLTQGLSDVNTRRQLKKHFTDRPVLGERNVEDASLIRWWHSKGVPQVVQLKESIFRFDGTTR